MFFITQILKAKNCFSLLFARKMFNMIINNAIKGQNLLYKLYSKHQLYVFLFVNIKIL